MSTMLERMFGDDMARRAAAASIATNGVLMVMTREDVKLLSARLNGESARSIRSSESKRPSRSSRSARRSNESTSAMSASASSNRPSAAA